MWAVADAFSGIPAQLTETTSVDLTALFNLISLS